MHFWIDKRSQCGYNWRRVPPSFSTGAGRARRERHLKPMVTPVHRFQSVECVTGGSSASSTRRPPNNATPHLHRPTIAPTIHQYHQQHLNPHTFNHSPVNNGIHLSPNQHRRGVEIDNSIYPDVSRSPAERSTSSVDQISVNRQLSDLTSNGPQPQPIQLMPTYLKCGVWASFALATMFVAGAKFYFDHQVIYEQGSGMEVLVFCALLVMFLLGACSISLCRARPVPPLGPIVVTSQFHQSNASSQDSNEDLALGTLLNFQANATPAPPPPEPPPPPYHIAVLLPQRNNSTFINMEVPPPTYEKAIS